MFPRLFVVVCLWVYSVAALSQGSTAGWSCQQKKGSQEWLCVTDKDTARGGGAEAHPMSPAITELVPATVTRIPKFSPEFTPVELPPGSIAKRPGWTCLSGEADETWDCSLMGRDPQGEGRVIVDDDFKSSIFQPAFTADQEDIFKMMQGDLKFDPWENCERLPVNRQDFAVDEPFRLSSPLVIEGDSAESFDNEVTTFVGNVEMVRADQRTLSDKASLDKVSSTIDAQGNVYYRADDISFYSDTSFMKLATDESRLRTALFISPGSRTRGTADVVYRESEFLTRYKNAAYTTCKPGNQDWVVHAQRIKLNKQTGKGAAKHAWLEFKGVPVFYTPYFAFPIDDRRVSGFLNAAWDNTEKNGLDFTVPYYWNMAPNYDAVLRPRYMSERGLMLAGDFRYLSASSRGKFSGEFLISDNKATALDEVTVNPHKGKQRGNFKWKNQSQWKPDLMTGDSLAFDVDVNYLSDDDYYNELANSFTVTQSTQMRSFSQLQYQTDEVLLSGLVEHYRTLDHSETKPYMRLPKINFNVNKTVDLDYVPLELAVENEFVYFDKNSGDIGSRINVKPSLSLPLQIAGLNMTPKVSVQHAQYWLEDATSHTKTEYSRTLPIVSMDTRFILEKEYDDVLGLNLIHAIEPRAYYLYIPEDDQSNPIFDTSLADFSSGQLFRENRFNGVDRLGDANQVTLGLTTRLSNTDTGLELAKLTVGQIYYFRDRSVVLPGGAVETSNYSPVIAELSGAMTAQLTYKANLFWDVDNQDVSRGRASLKYRGKDRELVNLGYNYRKNSIIQSDMSFLWSVYDDWSVFGGWVYSLKDNLSTEIFAGLEKENCCWRFRVLGKRYANANVNTVTTIDNERYDTGLFVQLELKGLTGLGDKLDAFLEQELPGYQSPAQ
jgi:LPS-assembly protein